MIIGTCVLSTPFAGCRQLRKSTPELQGIGCNIPVCYYWHFALNAGTETAVVIHVFSFPLAVQESGEWCVKYAESDSFFIWLIFVQPSFWLRINNIWPAQWPRGLRHGFAAARLLGPRVRISPGAWMLYVFAGTTLCHEPITRPGVSYRVCVIVCDHMQQKASTPSVVK